MMLDVLAGVQGKTVTGRRINALAAVQLAVSRRQAYSKGERRAAHDDAALNHG